VALLGFGFSAYKYFGDRRAEQEIRTAERLDKALERLGQNEPAQRLAAIVSLREFVNGPNELQKAQSLEALADHLGIEESLPVRNATIAIYEDINPSQIPKSILENVLRDLVEADRGLVREGDLWRKRSTNLWFIPADSSVEARADSVAEAIVVFLHKQIRRTDLSGIYLPSKDLSGLDLNGIDFSKSILAWCSFKGALLGGASFKNADLELVSFAQAKLENANFEQTDEVSRAGRSDNYVMLQLTRAADGAEERGETVRVCAEGPDFQNADLTGARFSGHLLFPFSPDDTPEPSIIGFEFVGANIKNADFTHVRMFGLEPGPSYLDKSTTQPRFHSGPFVFQSSGGAVTKDGKFIISDATVRDGWYEQPYGYERTLRNLVAMFSGTNWQDAKFGDGFAQLLRDHFKGMRSVPSTTTTKVN
jgi:uncharacterized protein YjbI with pentapeptide repeats